MQQATFGRRGVKPQPGWGAAPPAVAAPRPVERHQEAVEATLSWADVAGVGAEAAAPERTFASGVLPVGTLGIAVLMALLFWVELTAQLSPGAPLAPGYRTLVAVGGVNGRLALQDGQLWRVLTAPWLHASLSHLLGNAVVLVLIGRRLERLVGTAWFLAIYLVSGVGGAVASAVLNPGGPVSVGASGAIMGLIASAFVLSFHVQAEDMKGRLKMLAVRFMIPALIPTHAGVDYRCHLGGALAGAALGFVLQVIWPEDRARPVREREAGYAAAGLCALTAVGFLLTAAFYGGYARREAGLIPDALLLKAPADAATATDLQQRFPRDPRGYLYTGLAELKAGDAAGAEAALRTGLAQEDALANDMPPATTPMLQAALAASLQAQGRGEEARAAAAPVCAGAALALRAQAARAGLCAR
jgi:rhomboid protease GluP